MMAVLHIVMVLISAGLVVELFAAATAPIGCQDENGFHLGSNHADCGEDVQSGNPS